MSPKSFVRKPRKKRKAKPGFLLPLIVIFCLVIVVGIGILLYALHPTGIISPLQVAVGQKLQTMSVDTSDGELKRLLTSHHILYTSAQSQGDSYVINLNAKQQVFLTKKKDIDSQISSLQVILPRLTMEGREFRRLDMRYDKPVVVY